MGGPLRGHLLKTLNHSALRPTAILLKRRLFDYWQDWEGMHLVDFTAGTGAIGLEAFSRGAASVVLVEKDPKIRTILVENLQYCQAQAAKNPGSWGTIELVAKSAEGHWTTFRNQYALMGPAEQEKTVIFFDPPYENFQLYQRFFDFFLGEMDLPWFRGTLWVESDEKKGWGSKQMTGKRQQITKIFRQGSRFLIGIRSLID